MQIAKRLTLVVCAVLVCLVAVRDTFAQRGDDAREVPPRNMRQRHLGGILPGALLPVGGIDARRVDFYEHLAGSGHRIGQLAVLEDLRRAVAAEKGGFQGNPSFPAGTP